MSPAVTLPAHWNGVLTEAQWLRAVDAIGEQRVEEFHGLVAELSVPFRATFIDHLELLAPRHPAGEAVLLAIASATLAS